MSCNVLTINEKYRLEPKKPLVSCLMLTYNRFKAFKKAFECFFKQTYPNTELVIVNSGNQSYRAKVKKYIKKHGINYNIKHYECIGQASIGELRNGGLNICDGEYIIGFDDDDIHHPERISRQVDLCLKSNIDGTVLKNFTTKMWWKEHKCSSLNGLEGTLLFKNPKGSIKYTDMGQGEDTNFIYKLKENGYNIVVIDEDYDTYKYIYHNSNTVSRKHFKDMIELNKPIRN